MNKRLLALADALNRFCTWGMEPELRAELLMERRADLEAEASDDRWNHTRALLGRRVRTLLADIAGRAGAGDTTALPASIAMLVASAGVMVYTTTARSTTERVSLAFIGLGLAVLAGTGLRSPRLLPRRPIAFASVLIAIGAGAGAATMPITEETGIFDVFARLALVLATLGFVATAVAMTRSGWLLTGGGILIVGAAISHAFAGVGMAMAADTAQLWGAAVATTLGALLVTRFITRLRHIPIEDIPATRN